jgi:hypothetical protein
VSQDLTSEPKNQGAFADFANICPICAKDIGSGGARADANRPHAPAVRHGYWPPGIAGCRPRASRSAAGSVVRSFLLWPGRHGSWQRRTVIRIRKDRISWVLALAAGTASAREAVNVVVEFSAPSGCSDRETFAAGLRSRSERIQIIESNERGWIVGVRLTPKDRGVHGELRLTDEHGESELRAVDGVDCAEVVEALSFTAALAIERTVEQTAILATPRPASTGTPADALGHAGAAPTATAAAQTPPSTAMPPTNRQDKPPSPSLPSTDVGASDTTHVGVIAIATKRVSPQTNLGLSLTLSRQFVLTDGWAPEVAVRALYVPVDTLQPKSEIRVGYAAAALLGCPAVWVIEETVTLRPCVVFELGRLSVTDRAVDVSLPSKRLTGFVGGLGLSSVRLGRHVDFAVELGILTPLAARRYLTNSPGTEVGHTATIAWQAGAGWLFGW